MYYQAYHFLHQRKRSQKIEGKRRERTIQQPLIHLCINADHSLLSVFTWQAHIISFLAFASHRIFKLPISFSNILFLSMISSVTGAFFFLFITFGSRFFFLSHWPLPIPSKFMAWWQELTQSYADATYLCTQLVCVHVSAQVCFSSIVWLLWTPVRSL